MPSFEHEGASLYYEEFGAGYPVLLFAPGGMGSAIEIWHKSPWDPTIELAPHFRVIAMDQRNAGKSQAAIKATDGWTTYTSDHLALLDYLGIEETHVMGGCIGVSYCLGIIQAAPRRIKAAILQNPIGLSNGNRPAFMAMFDEWSQSLKKTRPELDDTALETFGQNMFGGEFVFNVSRDFVKGCPVPLFICAGNDQFHPAAIAQEIADLAPQAELRMKWRESDVVGETIEKAKVFLLAHTPNP